MPIVDVQLVSEGAPARPSLAQELADRVGLVLKAKPGQVWVRVATLPSENYAENQSKIGVHELPVFVTLLHANLPDEKDRAEEARNVSAVVAEVVGCLQTQVHVEYAPPGRGRMAFGGTLVNSQR